jgi:hypothetical protein
MDAQLVADVGSNPSIDRLVELRLQLDAFEAKLAAGAAWSCMIPGPTVPCTTPSG